MPARKQDAYKALELMEQYLHNLEGHPGTEELQEALTKAIVAIRSRLFQALLDIQEFYEFTLDNAAKSVEVKAEETRELAKKWESSNPPIPAEARRLAQSTIAPTNPPPIVNGDKKETKSQSPGKEEAPPQSIREDTVVIERHETSGLGLSIAGGVDNPHATGEYGIFITRLSPGSPAELSGLIQLGDQILSVNDVSLIDVPHIDAVTALKNAGTRVELRIRRYLDRVWSPASVDDVLDEPEIKERTSSPPPCRNIIEIELHKEGGGLGFSIAGGFGNQHVMGDDGIFVTKIIEGGVANKDGRLNVGDRILDVNGQSMVNIGHEEAVATLKATGQDVTIKLEKNALPQQEEDPAPADEDLINKPRIITLHRPEGVGLGFNIIGGEEDVGIFISVISKEGLASQDGQLRVGDMILEVNEENLENWSHETAAQALKTAGEYVKLKVVYKPEEFEEFYRRMNIRPEPEIKQLYVRALFSYDATSDADRPGEGLPFNQGDIIHILNGSDEEWWSAALVGPTAEDGQQGLIPSKRRLERRARANAKSVKFGEAEADRRNSSMSSKLRNSFKLKKLGFGKRNSSPSQPSASTADSDEPLDEEPIPTYEPVSLKKRGYTRPVIILGPLKEDINDKLVNEFPDKFAGCVPHTTRKPRPGEVDGRDYHFVTSVEQMERDIQAHLFIEAGRYKDNLYGTSIQAVREVAQQNKHCILGVSGYAIKRLHMADLLPIAICVQPDTPKVIKDAQPRINDENAEIIFEKGRGIQQDFGDAFTAVVDGRSLEEIYEKVKQVIHDNSSDLIWVPSNEEL